MVIIYESKAKKLYRTEKSSELTLAEDGEITGKS
jgi:hypothetical protein